MLNFYSIYEISKANYYQRIRNHKFLIAFVVIMIFIFIDLPSQNVNYETFSIDGYRGILNGAWIGVTVAFYSAGSLSSLGYFLIYDTIKFDEKTNVGQILGTTAVKNNEYLLGKTLSNFLILSSLLLFIILSSIGMFFIRAETNEFNIINFLLPFLIITIPCLAFVSLLEIVLESIPYSNRWIALGIFVCFLLLNIPGSTMQNFSILPFDFFGLNIIINSMISQILAINPTANIHNIVYGLLIPRQNPLMLFDYKGINFTIIDIVYRIFWIILGLALLFLVSPLFDRFGSKYSIIQFNKGKKQKNYSVNENEKSIPNTFAENKQTKLSFYDKKNISTNPFELAKSELNLLVNQRPKWFIYLSIVFIVLGFFASNSGLQLVIWSINWILPITIISSIGVKEYEFNTYPLLYSTRRPLINQFFIPLLTRWLILIFFNIGAIFVLLITGTSTRIIVLVSGSIFLIGLASFCGYFFKSNKIFEAIYLFIWLLGPLNAVPQLDFIGVTQTSVLYDSWIIFLLIGIITIIFSLILNIKRLTINEN